MATEASLKELTVRLEARRELTLAALMNIRAQGSGGVELGAKTPAANVDLRGGKGSLHEGGARVPTIFYRPAKLKLRIVNEPFGMVDMMPTLPALAGANAVRIIRSMAGHLWFNPDATWAFSLILVGALAQDLEYYGAQSMSAAGLVSRVTPLTIREMKEGPSRSAIRC